jgi:hypothetical protein
MERGQLLRINGVKSPQHIQFPIVVRGRIAQNRNLNVHRGPLHTIRVKTHDFLLNTRLGRPALV